MKTPIRGLRMKTRREYVVAYRADNGNVCAIRTPNTPTVLREYAEKDAEAVRSPEDQTEVFVAYRDLPEWRRVDDQLVTDESVR
jgi:hypothetical protein